MYQIDAPNTFNPQKNTSKFCLKGNLDHIWKQAVNKCTLYGMKPKCFFGFPLLLKATSNKKYVHHNCFKKKHLSISSGFKAPKRRTVHHFKAQRFQPVHKERFNPKIPKHRFFVGCTTHRTLKQSPREIDGLKHWKLFQFWGVKRPMLRRLFLKICQKKYPPGI